MNLRRLSRLGSLTLILLLAGLGNAAACPVCYGEEGSAEVEGVKWAMLFLLGITGTVLSAVIAFVLYVRRRAKMTLNGSVDMPSPN